jgi:SAM-dependent methyltransferase
MQGETVKQLIGGIFQKVVKGLEHRRTAMVLTQIHGRLLDVGCGENQLVRQYGNGIGVDVFDLGDVDLVVADTADLPFADQSFDTASFVASLNHIPNREAVLREAKRCLKEDGRIVVTMIPPHLSIVWHRIIRPWDPDQIERGIKAGEVWGFTRRQMQNLLRDAGFQIVSHKRFEFGLNNLYVATKADQRQA